MKELLLLSGLGILSLIAEILNVRKLIYPLVILGLLLNIGLCVHDFGNNENIYGMMVLDRIPLALTILFSFIAILWFTMANSYFKDETNLSDHFSLVLFSLVGVFILTSYTHLVMLFLGVEILSIPVYVLAGSDKRNVYSNEAAFKYFLLGAFASGFLLLGITFIYGALGSFNVVQIASTAMSPFGVSPQLLIVGFLLILFAMAFKMSAVPFHFWAPDVYTGAPTVITAYMSTIVKIGAIAGFYRLFSIVISFYSEYNRILLLIAALTIVVGNIIAASQSNVKRLLAYSSIGHAGFLILGITALSASTPYITWYYLLAYSLSSIASFWVLLLVSEKSGEEDITAFNGLVKRNPVLAGTMTIALLSMAGIPPLAGFFAKYFILINVIDKGYILIAVVAILASLIGVYYYFKIIIAMFTGTAEDTSSIEVPVFYKVVLVLISIILLAVGVVPDLIFSLIFR
ncbi:MAG: NADH-quinone oxidoreductase subunit N [Chitinophagales bacterium]